MLPPVSKKKGPPPPHKTSFFRSTPITSGEHINGFIRSTLVRRNILSSSLQTFTKGSQCTMVIFIQISVSCKNNIFAIVKYAKSASFLLVGTVQYKQGSGLTSGLSILGVDIRTTKYTYQWRHSLTSCGKCNFKEFRMSKVKHVSSKRDPHPPYPGEKLSELLHYLPITYSKCVYYLPITYITRSAFIKSTTSLLHI